MNKKIIISSLLLFTIFLTGCDTQANQANLLNSENIENPSVSQEDENKEASVNVYFFWGEGCPHCAHEKPFLEKMEKKYPEIRIKEYEVWGSTQNQKLMQAFGEKLNATVNGVPFTVIGEEYTVGWMDEKYTGGQIENAINECMQETCRDIGKEMASS